MDTSAFGVPSAAFPASGCNITQFFGPQRFVLLTTLCGVWAGVPRIYSSTCPGNCVLDNVIGPGSPKYDTAYWEIPYIRTYIADNLAVPPSSSSPANPGSPVTSTSVVLVTPTAAPAGGVNTGSGSDAVRMGAGVMSVVGAVWALWVIWGFI